MGAVAWARTRGRRLYEATVRRAWWAVLAVLFAAGIFFGRHVPDLDVDATTRVLLNEDDPDLAYYESTRPLWGYDEYAIVAVTREEGWVSPEGIALLAEMVGQLEKIEHTDGVTSLLEVPLLRQEGGLIPRPSQFRTLEDEGLDWEKARAEILDHELVAGALVSEDGRDTALLVYVDVPPLVIELDQRWAELQARRLEDPSVQEELDRLRPRLDVASDQLSARRAVVVEGVRAFADRWSERLGEPVRLSGAAIINKNIVEHLRHDLRIFGVACFALFLLAFLLIYRRLRFVVLPIVTCLLPVAIIVGWMAWRGMKVTITTANLPILLFVLLLPYTVYLIERYRERRAGAPGESQTASTLAAARSIFVPCLFSCTTTMAGFFALMTSDTNPVRAFGRMMGIGMGVGLAVVFLALPSMSRPLSPLAVPATGAGVGRAARGLVGILERLAARHPRVVLLGGGLLLVLAVLGAMRLDAESKFTEYFWPSSEVHRGLEYIDTRLGGTTTLEVMLESEEEGHFLTKEGLEALEAVGTFFDDVEEVGHVDSLATIVTELEKRTRAARTFLPVIARMDVVRPLLDAHVAEDGRVARVVARLRETAPTLDREAILAALDEHLASSESLEGLEVRKTGIFVLYSNMLQSLIQSQQETFLYVLVAVWVMLVILFGSPVLALLVLLPQVLPALTMLGVMGWWGVPLDLVTVMIAAIALGVGIDAAIQYTFRYRRELAEDGDRVAALGRAHATIGRAIWIATTIIVIGFCVLVLSRFRPSVYFGVFTAVAMLMSQVAALTILPALLLLARQPRAG